MRNVLSNTIVFLDYGEDDFLLEQSDRLTIVDYNYGFKCVDAQEFRRIAEGDEDA